MPRKKKATRKAAKRGRRVKKAPRRQAATAAVPAAAQAMAGLQRYHSELLAERAKIDAQIASVEGALKTMGGATAPARRRGRPAGGAGAARSGSLKEYIEQVLAAGGTMAVRDIADAVLAAGYPTKNKTLAKSVGIALTQMPSVQKVSRGKFRLK